MTTTQRERPMVVAAPSRTRRRRLVVGMLVIGLLIGLLGGWLLFRSDDVVTVDGSALTDRQAEMVATIEDAFAAWQDNDVDEVLSHYQSTGRFIALGVEYPVEDGSLAAYVRSFYGASGMTSVGPHVVIDHNTVLSFHTLMGTTYTSTYEFTSGGEVLISVHDVTN